MWPQSNGEKRWDKQVHGKGVLEDLELRDDSALFNLKTGLGTTKDPRTHTGIQEVPNLTDAQVEALVKSSWHARKMVDELPAEAVRKWIKLVADMTGSTSPGNGTKRVFKLLERKKARQKIEQALKWERQYGGAIIVAGVPDSSEPTEPLDLEEMRKGSGEVLFFDVFSRKRILTPTASDLESDPRSPQFGRPRVYQVLNRITGSTMRVHWTRAFPLQGWTPHERDRDFDFGISLLNTFWPALRDYQSTMGYALGIASRMSQRVVRQNKLFNLLTGTQKQRNSVAAMWEEISLIQSVFNVFLVDKEDEVENLTVNLAGVSDIIKMAREDLAAATGFSSQRFFGLQQQGLSNNDESGSERDDAVVAAFQRDRLKGIVDWMVDLATASLGLPADTIEAEFVPLREETPGARAERKKTEAEAAEIHVSKIGSIHSEEVRATLQSDQDPLFQLREGSLADNFGDSESLEGTNSGGFDELESPGE